MRRGLGTRVVKKGPFGIGKVTDRKKTRTLREKARANVNVRSAEKLGYNKTDAKAIAGSMKNKSTSPSLVNKNQIKQVKTVTTARRKALATKLMARKLRSKANELNQSASRTVAKTINKAKRRL
jgi:hypothetical protein